LKSNESQEILIKVLFFISLICLVWYVIHFYEDFLLPGTLGKFHFDDFFMDFYNTVEHADRHDKYYGWKSIYLPLNFIVSKLFLSSDCANIGGFSSLYIRLCDNNYAVITLVSIHILSMYFYAVKVGRCINLKSIQIPMLFFVFLLSPPSLFLIERGNLLIVLNLTLSIIFLINEGLIKTILMAFAINIKQYMVIPLAFYLLNKKTKDKLATILFSIATLLATYYYYESTLPIEIFNNMLSFSGSVASPYEKLWNPTSIMSIIKALEAIYNKALHEPILITLVILILKVIYYAILLLALFIFYVLIKEKKRNNSGMLYLISTMILLMITDTIGGYGYTLLFPFLGFFLLKIKKFGILFFVCLIFPIDITFSVDRLVFQNNYWTGIYGYYESPLSVLSLVRAILLPLSILFVFKNRREFL